MIEEHEEQLKQAFAAFTRLERTLQQAVGEALSSYYGTGWVKHIPQSIRQNCERKMKAEAESSVAGGFPERQRGLLKYADFGQIVGIIENQWDEVFHHWFRDKQTALRLLGYIQQYRNALMHSALLPKDAQSLVSLCEDMLKQLERAQKDAPAPKKSARAAPPPLADTVSLTPPASATEEQRRFVQQVMAVLNQMSGLFEGERDAVLSLIERRLRLATPGLVELVGQKFSGLPGTRDLVNRLHNRLPPQRPAAPDAAWGAKASKWLKWASDSYIPYRYWMIVNEQTDDDLEALSLAYEDWLYTSYGKLTERPEQFVKGTFAHISQLLNNGQKVLWVLVDGLPFFLRGVLAKLLEESGFVIQQIDRQLAMLPSETSVSRRCALTGKWPNDLNPALADKDAILQAWWGRTHKIYVLEQLNDLERVDQHLADLYIYVYSRLDELFHKPDSKDFQREEELESALTRLTSRLYVAMTKLCERDRAGLVISSDHGSTRISGRSSQLPAPPSAVKDGLYEEHKRFIRVAGRDALNDVDWYFLDKDVFHLNCHYAIARGWRSINAAPRGFTHGGLSPEETVVPMFTCELGRSEFEREKPTYEQVSSPLRLGRPGELIVLVRNPYRVPVENLTITLTDFGDVLGPIDIEPQMEMKTAPIEIKLPSKMTIEDDAVFVAVLVEFTAGGQLRAHQTKLRLKVRQLFKTDLDEEFGAMF